METIPNQEALPGLTLLELGKHGIDVTRVAEQLALPEEGDES